MPPALKRQWDSRDGRDRSPQPYARKGSVSRIDIKDLPTRGNATGDRSHLGSGFDNSVSSEDNAGNESNNGHNGWRQASASHTASSESGTEADDENENQKHSQLLKALPPPLLRPRKGLKGDSLLDGDFSPLLTPAELDRDDRRISSGYFEARDGKSKGEKEQASDDEHVVAAKALFEKRRRAERVRRISEGALLGAIGLVVISGPLVWTELWIWNRELLSQIFTVAFVVAIYPVRVLVRDHLDGNVTSKDKSVFKRFRIPASFDPATVIYPTFIPVLVALSLLPQFPALLLPNLILGLASLPPRLFPPTSRLIGINTLGWMVATVPLILSEYTEFPANRNLTLPYRLKVHGSPYLHPEILVLLYPLHQAMLPALHYLTTSSLLAAEKNMLATGLVNLLCFAISPQAAIMRAMVWIGGVWVLVSCTHILRWNVALARVPKWRFRRTASEGGDLIEGLVTALRDLLRRGRRQDDESDADEDDPVLPRRDSKFTPPRLSPASLPSPSDEQEPKSAVEASPKGTLDLISGYTASARKRRHTIPTVDDRTAFLGLHRSDTGQSKHCRQRAWYLDLTLEGAVLRKWLYASWFYAVIIAIGLGPVRMAVSRHALKGAEPVVWAIDYVLGDLIAIYYSHKKLAESVTSYAIQLQQAAMYNLAWNHFSVPDMRSAVGEANTRILLAIYWVVVVTLGITTVTYLSPRIEVDTRRKIFHATIVTMLLPTIFIDPCFCALALSLGLAIFMLLEVIRAGQVPPLGAAIGRFIAPYVDGRDLRGPMVVSHVFLLIGCAIPLWLSLSGLNRAGKGRWPGWETELDFRDLAMIAGVVCVGMGDAAASLIGRRYGKRKWPWIGGKSLEGSAAFAVAVAIGLMAAKSWIHFGGWNEEAVKAHRSGAAWSPAGYWTLQSAKALLCGVGSSFMEAVLTGANDNVVVPVALWLLVRGTGL